MIHWKSYYSCKLRSPKCKPLDLHSSKLNLSCHWLIKIWNIGKFLCHKIRLKILNLVQRKGKLDWIIKHKCSFWAKITHWMLVLSTQLIRKGRQLLFRSYPLCMSVNLWLIDRQLQSYKLFLICRLIEAGYCLLCHAPGSLYHNLGMTLQNQLGKYNLWAQLFDVFQWVVTFALKTRE